MRQAQGKAERRHDNKHVLSRQEEWLYSARKIPAGGGALSAKLRGKYGIGGRGGELIRNG